MIVNLSECADIFGVEMNTIKAWVRKGCPAIQVGSKGRPWQIDTQEVHAWRESAVREEAYGAIDKTEIDEARRRKMVAEAAMSELELQRKRGEVIPIEEQIRLQAGREANMRARLLAAPNKLAPLMEGMSTDERRAEIERVIKDALAELSQGVSTEAA